jgi:hypothetical protein
MIRCLYENDRQIRSGARPEIRHAYFAVPGLRHTGRSGRIFRAHLHPRFPQTASRPLPYPGQHENHSRPSATNRRQTSAGRLSCGGQSTCAWRRNPCAKVGYSGICPQLPLADWVARGPRPHHSSWWRTQSAYRQLPRHGITRSRRLRRPRRLLSLPARRSGKSRALTASRLPDIAVHFVLRRRVPTHRLRHDAWPSAAHRHATGPPGSRT